MMMMIHQKKTVTEMLGKSDLYSCSIVSCKHQQETLPNPAAPLLQTVVSHPDEISRDSPHQYGCPEKTPRQPRCGSRYQGKISEMCIYVLVDCVILCNTWG